MNLGSFPMQYPRAMMRVAFGAVLAGLIIAATPSAEAAIYSPQQALPADAIQQFMSNPSAFLAQYPSGGPQMSRAVRDLVASDPQTLNTLLSLLSSANPDQSSAIGTGLGQVALMAVDTDQAFAVQIQTAVAQSGNTGALVAFSAVVGGDIKLAAATGGGGAGGGGEEGTGPGAPGFSGFIASTLDLHTFATNTADSFTTPTFTPGTPGTPTFTPGTPGTPSVSGSTP
jgi:hypothetical protein